MTYTIVWGGVLFTFGAQICRDRVTCLAAVTGALDFLGWNSASPAALASAPALPPSITFVAAASVAFRFRRLVLVFSPFSPFPLDLALLLSTGTAPSLPNAVRAEYRARHPTNVAVATVSPNEVSSDNSNMFIFLAASAELHLKPFLY